MRRWSVFVVLAVIVLGLLIAMELQTGEGVGGESQKTVYLATRTATATRTAGWWTDVATWTPSPSGVAGTASNTQTAQPSGTPELVIPPVRTQAAPTLQPTWTRRP